MNTLHHFSHQGMLLAQFFVAALVMLGLGLEGMGSDEEALQAERRND